MKKILLAIMFSTVVFLTSCADKAVVVNDPPVIESDSILLERCTADTPIPEKYVIDKDGKKVYNGEEALHTMTKWQTVYDVCAQRHDALVKLLLDLQKDRTVILKKR